jgi:hypothetical protein
MLNNQLRKDCLHRNHWNSLLESRVVIGEFKRQHNHRDRHSALGYRTPAEYAAACRCAHTRGPAASTESRTHRPDSNPLDSATGTRHCDPLTECRE